VTDLDGAVARGEIVAVFQPQVDVRTRRVVAVEALARWRHPELGLVAPDIFIPLAEEHELIAQIGDFMFDQGCRCAAEWQALGHPVDVAVNVSAAQLMTLDFLDLVAESIARHGLSPESLIIEITESLPLENVPEVTARLFELRDLGLGISIDDFGTGYSSLAQVLALPATELKLDQSLIKDTHSSPLTVHEAVAMAHGKGLRVVAEGVETEEQFALARELECDRAQGYLFSRPISEAELGLLLAAS
jgi:EAL domain-containing protein (putative c-di-GMP-specific phosphodiesterase class I)